MTLKRKIDIRHAIKMRNQGATQLVIAKTFGCSVAAVCKALQSVKALVLPQEQLDEFRRVQADVLDTVSAVYLQEQLNPDKIKATSAKDAAIINGIAIEKSRLIRGQSTSNNEIDIRAWIQRVNVPAEVIEGEVTDVSA